MKPPLREQLAHAVVRFRNAGNRFVSSDPEWFEPRGKPGEAELTVLHRLLEAWAEEAGTMIYFRAHDVRSPVFEAADLVVAHPSIGFVIVEVKSHGLQGLDVSDGQLAVKYGKSTRKPVGRQGKQQLSYLLGLLKEARGRASARLGGSYLIAFPNVSRSAFLDSPLARGGHQERHLVFAEDLDSERLRARCRVAAENAAKRSRTRLPADRKGLHLLSRVLGELDSTQTITAGDLTCPNAVTLRERLDRMHVSNCLDPQQREMALGRYEARPMLIRGVAGSGKSLILVQNLVASVARRAQEAPRGRYLVTCFNRTLVPLLRERIECTAQRFDVDLGACEITVSHFEGVLREIGKILDVTVPNCHTTNEVRCPPLLAAVEEALSDRPELADSLPDMIYVDEAQDLEPEALRLLHGLCRVHPETGERGFVMAYDDAQNLYGRKRPVWKDLGINLMGGRTRALDESRRTTRPIATFAFNVLLGSALESETRAGMRGYADVARLADVGGILELDAGLVVDFAPRSGLPPLVDVFEDFEAEARHVATAIVDLVREQRVRPEEILIQTDDQWKTLDPIRAALEALPGAPPCHVIINDKDALAIRPGSVAFSTILSAKGYDAPIVFLVNANGFGTSPEDRARFYVGATRAQIQLHVTAHGDPDAGLLLEMREIRRRLPALVGHDMGSEE